jgi:hypothetical protein
MTAGALGEERPTLFLRKATGLVRGWSVRDSMIYACLSTNVVTLGMVEWADQSLFPNGNLLYSILISGVWVSFLVIAYTGLVVTIPRAGGDYVWQSRILNSGLGFVMAATGWWFILWLWAPIYGTVLSEEFFQPLWATTGHAGAASWFATHNGIFVVTLITIVLAGVLVSIGMAGYARVQKWCFYGGLVGFAIILIILLIPRRRNESDRPRLRRLYRGSDNRPGLGPLRSRRSAQSPPPRLGAGRSRRHDNPGRHLAGFARAVDRGEGLAPRRRRDHACACRSPARHR